MTNKRTATTSQRLKEAMEEKGFKQIDLVKKAEVDKGALSSYLKGKYEPKDKTIMKLAKALDVSEMWLWGYEVPKERTLAQKNNDIASDIVIRMKKDEEFFQLIEKLNALDPDQLKRILVYLNAFNKNSLD